MELRAALAAVEAEAFPLLQEVRYREEQINGLRACPAPDSETLAALAEALVGGHYDAD